MVRRKTLSPAVLVGLKAGHWKRKTGPDPYQVLIKTQYNRRGPKEFHHPPSSPPPATNLNGPGVVLPLRPQTQNFRDITLLNTKNNAYKYRFGGFSPRTEFVCNQDLPFYLGFMQKESPKISDMLNETIDLVIEVRDVRAPFTSSNFYITDNIPSRVPRIILLNKADLIEPRFAKAARNVLTTAGNTCFLTHGHDRSAARIIREWIFENCFPHWTTIGRRVMVIGLPNVGKSSFVNSMRTEAALLGEALGHVGRLALTKDVYKEKLSLVAAEPTTTRHVLPFKITHDPRLYLYDTPGIMLPRLRDKEAAVKLACINIIPARVGDIRYVADYLLYRLNQANCFDYVDEFFLDRPTNNVIELADRIWAILHADQRIVPPRATYAYETFLHRFAVGRLGRIPLDYIPAASDLAYRGELNISEPPGPWGPSQYPEPLQGIS